jgi:transcriptional antiterminator RfaH
MNPFQAVKLCRIVSQEGELFLTTDRANNIQRTTSHWYVAHCQRLKEWQAAAALEEHLDLAVYLPEVRRRGSRHVRRSPFFPGYLFVRADLRQVALSRINAMPGVLRLVAFGDLPQSVPVAVIEEIRQRVDDLNTHGGLPAHDFRPGETLRLKDGPLHALEAIFVGPTDPSERVQVLIEFLGSLRKMDVDASWLERAGDAPAPWRERRTRGNGRLIKRHH